MILTLDIGNTRTHIGLYDGEQMKKFCLFTADLLNNLSQCLESNLCNIHIDGAIVCSVVNDLNNGVVSVLKELYGVEPVVVSSNINLPIHLNVDEPEKLGVDRIVNGAFAYSLYNQAVIVIDCGSAITFDIVDNSGNFLGGVIALGLKNHLKALSNSTFALPSLDIEKVEFAIGKNTKQAILSGVVLGTAKMVDGIIDSCKKELKVNTKIILTGGDAPSLQKYLTHHIDLCSTDYTLDALNYLYNFQMRNII